MENLIRGRRPLRGQLQRLADETSGILKKPTVSQEDDRILRANYDLIESTMTLIQDWDDRVKTEMFENPVSEDAEDLEYRDMEKFRRIYLDAKGDIDEYYARKIAAETTDTASVNSSSTGKKKKYHLPEVKLKTFGGNLKDWLGWWSQFRQIHEDEELYTGDKFIYLVQAMEKGSEAEQFVESFPMIPENYEKAVEALRERFGRDDLLLQVYIRELLTLVITNVTTQERLPLSQLYIRLESHLRSLAELHLDKADPATWLFPLVESSLSEDTLRAWQRSTFSRNDGAEKTRLELLMEFIKSEVRSDQQIALAQKGFQETSRKTLNPMRTVRSKVVRPNNTEVVPTAAGLYAGASGNCGFCDKPHQPEHCYKAKSMTMDQRRDIIRKKGLCYQCLKSGHIRRDCLSKAKCGNCGGGHFEIVCKSKPSSTKRGTNNDSGPSSKRVRFVGNPDGDIRIVSQNSNQCYGKILLNTIKVKVQDRDGNFLTLRLVGDNGSQRSFGSIDILRKAKCSEVGSEWLQTVLFGGEVTVPKCYPKKKITLIGFNGAEMAFELLEKKTLTGEIQEIPSGPWLREAEENGIVLNDVGDSQTQADVLIGNDYWGAIRTGKMVHLTCGLVAEETIFGWTVGGPISCATMSSNVIKTVPAQDIEKLWNLDLIGIRDPAETRSLKEEEESAMELFKKTVTRDSDGKYVVTLPWKMDKTVLPSNQKVAVQRLRSTTDRLQKTGKLNLYHDVFKGWEKESLITKVVTDGSGHFIPHRPVFKESTTTPVRPVFDASCRQGRNPSLNDCLYKGPNLIELIPTMILRFSEKKFGVSADIRKAFQMIGVQPEDRKFQKFLWWENETCKTMVTYQHNRVVFGITSSPFLLGATINVHLDNGDDREMAEKLKKSFYVDNVLTSVDSIEEYADLKTRSNRIMKMANMELRQWACSAVEEDATSEEVVPVLGLVWNRVEDTMSCSIKKIIIDDVITKRMMLSVVAQVFDPMGYLAPALLVPKLMIQEAWSQKCGWDEPIPNEVSQKFKTWATQLEVLSHLQVPRFNKVPDAAKAEVHVLCDSSKDGMASVAFWRTEADGDVRLQFLLCKSRLTPIKKMTIPRSELVSCVIGVRIAKAISEALGISMAQFTFWSDSSTALTWIRRPGNWGVFVSNRVKEILLMTNATQWHHVPGKENPADLPSRGCSPRVLLESKWWEGPHWLQKTPVPYLDLLPIVNEVEVSAELKKTVTAMTSNVRQPRFSSYRRNIEIWGWVMRFVDNCRGASKVKTPYLSIGELRKAEKIVLREIQQDSFPDGCKEISGIVVDKDADGLLRVRSRLGYRQDKSDFIHPIALPKAHPMVDLLVSDVHRYYGHGGVQFLLRKLREKYWIMQSRRVIRRVIKECVPCKRHTSKPLTVEPAPLPALRVQDCEAFATTGVDLAGPLFLRDGSKAWIVIFTCAVYRAVYLDLVTSLSTEDFIGALERFVSLHGRPNTIYSDNGTNFVGASNLFSKVDWASVEKETNARQIQWIFNPPSAAWWGGFWERLIRSVKDLLKRMLRRARLSYDELRTCLCGVASTINDRPLTVVSEDNMDLVALTPAMFLRPRGYGHMPDSDDVDGLRRGYKKMKEIQRALQDRFRKEYLSLLVTRGGTKRQEQIRIGDVVLVGSDNRKRYEWPLGIVTDFLPGKDGVTRVVRVKTTTGTFLRPLQRLYPLEVTKNEIEDVGGVKIPSRKVDRRVSRYGREVKKPTRYGQWFHLVVSV